MFDFNYRISELKIIEEKQKRKYDLLSYLRLLVFVLGAGITIILYRKGFGGYSAITAAAAVFIFLILVIKHSIIQKELNRTKAAIRVNNNYIDRTNGKWTEFSDNGSEFADDSHEFTSDLDLFGPKSLFQWINTAHTYKGRRILWGFLSIPDRDIKSIKMRQSAVSELGGKFDFCEKLEVEGIITKEVSNDPSELIRYSENKEIIFKKPWMINIFYVIPFITILSFALMFFGFPISSYIPAIMLSFQIILMGAGHLILTPSLNKVRKFRNSIGAYKNIIKLIEEEKFEEPLLKKIKSEFFEDSKSASQRIGSLEKIADAIDFRYNTIPYLILNIVLLWDYHCVIALEEWKKNNGELIHNWIDNIGYLEALSSLGAIVSINPDWCFSDFIEKEIGFSASSLGHPLIQREKRVCNNINVKNNLCIITGSNMSGKTTLLRTIGINLVLAYSGAPVCAEEFKCSIMSIFTSMRVADDLNSGISTFYAELLRIKMIVEYSKKKLPMIFLIDELFRGTNSKDRILGARSLVRNLANSWIIGLLSTHDFELCDLEHEECVRIVNYHFSESYENNNIRFDYKLKNGRSNSTNARYLMKMVGIDILE